MYIEKEIQLRYLIASQVSVSGRTIMIQDNKFRRREDDSETAETYGIRGWRRGEI